MTTTSKPVCWWDHTVWVDGRVDRSRTSVEGIAPRGSVGYVVCSPACPERPKGADCWSQDDVGRAA